MSRPLIVVDVQRGFMNEFTHHIPERLVLLLDRGDHDPVLFTRFVNIPSSPYQKFLDWHELDKPPAIEIVPELEPYAKKGRVYEKRGYTGLPDALATYLRRSRSKEVEIAGIDTDMCVLKIAMDVFDLGIKPIVLTDCCASTLGSQAHLTGLAILSRNVGPQQLRDAGLSQGTVAAPPEADS